MLLGIAVHSYEQNAVNLPGSFAWLACSIDPLPHRTGDLGRHQRLDRRSGYQRLDGVQRHSRHLFLGPRLEDQRCRGGDLADRGARFVRELDHARVLGMIRHARPVERRIDLDVVAQRMLDRLALEVLVGVGRRGGEVADRERVERPAGMDVCLAEVRVAVRILLRNGRAERQAHRRRNQQTRPAAFRQFHDPLPRL